MPPPFIYSPSETKLKKRLKFARWYLKNRETQRQKSKDFHKNNPEKSREQTKKWRANNPDRARFLQQRWEQNNPEKRRASSIRRNRKRLTDPINRLKLRLNTRVRLALKKSGIRKSALTCDLIGCTIPQLRVHFEAQFQPGMSWNNHTIRGWHIDHIVACKYFDLSDVNEQRRCFHYTNLQPLWWFENVRKDAGKVTDAEKRARQDAIRMKAGNSWRE